MRRMFIVLLISTVALLGAQSKNSQSADPPPDPVEEEDIDLDQDEGALPSIEDLGYFLSRLSEHRKGDALNILMDLAADSRLTRDETTEVLNRLLDEGSPPEEFGYSCPTCFQKRLSSLLKPLRLKGPKVAGPQRGFVVLPVNERLLKKIRKDSRESFGGSLPAFVKGLLDGYNPTGQWNSWAYTRYHGKGEDVTTEPVFFSSVEALKDHETSLNEPLDAWGLARYLCIDPPRSRFDPGYLVLEFDVTKTCKQVHIPTAGDCENADFRPSPQSEFEAGRTCGGAPEWVCPNFPMSAIDAVRFVANDSYVRGMR